MKFGVLGCGAEGGLFAGYLSKAGHDVYAYDIDERLVEKIDEDGIHVVQNDSTEFTAPVEASVDPTVLEGTDVVFVYVRAHQTADAMDAVSEIINDEMRFATLQNGFRNCEVIGEFVPDENVFGGYTEIGADYRYDSDGGIVVGSVVQHGDGDTGIGGPDEEFAATLAETLTEAGIETSVVDDRRAGIWNKQLVSVAIKPIAGLCELKNGEMVECAETRALMRKLIDETISVFEAEGVPVYQTDPVEHTFEICRRNAEKKSSILTDVENERTSEIDEINGFIAERGAELGVETPHNAITWNLVTGKEFGYTRQ